jgi:hypothetical protein
VSETEGRQMNAALPVPDAQPDVPLTPQPFPASDRVPALAWLIGAAFAAVEVAVSGRYGFMQDELYFLVAGHHLAFGYVDQPPLAPLLTRITGILGVSPTAIRIIPALAGGAVVVAAARFAALFGAGRLGRILAALSTACAPVLLGATHYANTTPLDLLAWTATLLCAATALLRDRPRWWIGAGIAAGLGLENEYLVVMLVLGLVAGVVLTGRAEVLRSKWLWLGTGIAVAIWAPNLIWQATHGWPQLTMASALHAENDSAKDYAGALPGQVLYAGLLAEPLLFAGFVRLWRIRSLRFIAVAVTLIVLYVMLWVPGKTYYSDGMLPAVLAAGSVSAEGWIARARWPRLLRGALITAPLLGTVLLLPYLLPVLPADDLSHVSNLEQNASSMVDTIGWPQLTRAVAAQDTALTQAGQAPTSIFTGYYGEAGALQVLGSGYHLPPVLSGHNAYWMWGPGQASDRTVLVVDAIGQLSPYFASCRVLTTYYAPDNVQNDYTDLQIGVCTGPVASWQTIWPLLKHYD